MKKHPIEAQIVAYLDSLDHQPSATEFFKQFQSQPRLLEYLVISSLYIDYDAEGIINENFKFCKDSEKIESLIEEYSDFPELCEMFIPKNVIAASIYKDFGNKEEAQELIDWLMQRNYLGYYQEVYSIKDLLFDGLINLEVANCPMNSQELITFLEEKIEAGEVSSLSDADNALNFENFLFYHLNRYFKIQGADAAQEIINQYLKKRDLDLNPINSFSSFLSGQLKPDSVHLQLNLHGLKNLVQGVEVAKIKIKTDIGKILTGFGSTVVKDQVANAITDYLVTKLPFSKEIQLGKNLMQAFISNMFEMADVNFLIEEMRDHRDNVLELNISVKEYYINHFLADEFKIFFKENNLEYIEDELNPIYNRLYASFIQSVNNILTPDLSKELLKASDYKSFDLETRKFLMVCDHLLNSSQPKIKVGFAKLR